jgi:hypothetical protein
VLGGLPPATSPTSEARYRDAREMVEHDSRVSPRNRSTESHGDRSVCQRRPRDAEARGARREALGAERRSARRGDKPKRSFQHASAAISPLIRRPRLRVSRRRCWASWPLQNCHSDFGDFCWTLRAARLMFRGAACGGFVSTDGHLETAHRSAGSLDATSPGLDLKMDALNSGRAFPPRVERPGACLRAVAPSDLGLNQRILK